MTILRGKGVLQGKSPKLILEFPVVFFGGAGWGEGVGRVISNTSSCGGMDIFWNNTI